MQKYQKEELFLKSWVFRALRSSIQGAALKTRQLLKKLDQNFYTCNSPFFDQISEAEGRGNSKNYSFKNAGTPAGAAPHYFFLRRYLSSLSFMLSGISRFTGQRTALTMRSVNAVMKSMSFTMCSAFMTATVS